MSISILVVLCCLSYVCFGQRGTELRHVKVKDERSRYGRTIIYGCFVHVPGIYPEKDVNSGRTYRDRIGLYNIDNGSYYFFQIGYGDEEGSFFRWYLPPGKYMILKHYRGKSRFENIYKSGRVIGYDDDDNDPMDEIQKRYTFYVARDTVTYIGTWHFENYQVSFKDEKIWHDSTELNNTFFRAKLDLTQCLTNIPK